MRARLHHIGILVDDLEKSAEEYQSRYGYQVLGQPIHDPYQTAYVIVLQGQIGHPLVELVSPDGPSSKLANALSKGGGLNHLAYLCREIEQECSRLRGLGMFLLQPPVSADAFIGQRIAWLMGRDGIPIELVEEAKIS